MAFPSDIPDLVARFVAADIAVADGTAVSSWPSTDGLNIAEEAVVDYQPIYRATGIGGKPAVEFDGLNDRLNVSAVDSPILAYSNTLAAETIFAVLSTDDTATNRTAFLATSGSGSLRQGFQQRSTGNYSWTVRRDGAATIRIVTPAGTSPTGGSAFSAAGDYVAQGITVYQNGAVGATDTMSTNSTTEASNSSAFRIGCNSGQTGEWWDGMIAEFMIYKRVLTDTERGKVHSYIQDTYGIVVSDYVSSAALTTYRPNATVLAGGWALPDGSTATTMEQALSDQISTTHILGTGV